MARYLKKGISAALLLALIMAGTLAPVPAKAAAPQVNAQGAALLDLRSGRILFAQNAHEKLPMASTTKVMTALLAIENLPLDKVITVPKEAYGAEGSSMYLNLGEKMTLNDLLYGLMLTSGNDAAITIAVAVGGSVEGFANMMNKKAKEIGALNTNFVTPNGLHDDNHYTTAYDLALICRAAMEREEFKAIVSAQYHKTTSGDQERTLKNKNKLLWQYEGANGIKTGYTKAAGKCLTFSAQRGGNTVIGVVLNSPDMWICAKNMMDYGFDEYRYETIVRAGDSITNIQVKNGIQNRLEIVAKEDILLPLDSEEKAEDFQLIKNCPYVLEAPIYAGRQVGSLDISLNGNILSSTPLIAQDTVYKKDYRYYLKRVLEGLAA
ncbi:D-alanyl-D-alanine carboxypeptidase [Christensenellaceae bacterium OttesenSCG-928-M15]|nr:D-alanyl-D-alanine carboxypeptidase [Christensenellaceae bacterium OttesenSCG-928-M15]